MHREPELGCGTPTPGDIGMNDRLRLHSRMARIYLYREPVDFRKSFRGLASIVE